MTELLHEKCPSFFDLDDMNLSKASESLAKAKETRNANERDELLKESFTLFQNTAKIITVPKLSQVCNEFVALRFHPAAVQLCLLTAHEKDKELLGLSFVLDNASNTNVSAFSGISYL